MPALISITDGEPVGWVTGPDVQTVFNNARSSLGDHHPVIQELYRIKDGIDTGFISTEAKQQIMPGYWLLLD